MHLQKKLAVIFLMCVCMLGLAACGTKIGSGADRQQGYYFTVKDQKLYMNEQMSTVLEWLGQPIAGVFESENCVFGGRDIFYYYNGYTLRAYEKDNSRYLYSIIFEDDTIKTSENVGIGSELALVKQKYGEEYSMVGNSTYVYTKDNMTLSFLIENNKVSAVTYSLIKP